MAAPKMFYRHRIFIPYQFPYFSAPLCPIFLALNVVSIILLTGPDLPCCLHQHQQYLIAFANPLLEQDLQPHFRWLHGNSLAADSVKHIGNYRSPLDHKYADYYSDEVTFSSSEIIGSADSVDIPSGNGPASGTIAGNAGGRSPKTNLGSHLSHQLKGNEWSESKPSDSGRDGATRGRGGPSPKNRFPSDDFMSNSNLKRPYLAESMAQPAATGSFPLGAKQGDALAAVASRGASFVANTYNSSSECHVRCMQKFTQAMKAAVHSLNHYDRFRDVCNSFNATVVCMHTVPGGCEFQEAFDIMTSGLHFMCIEQRKAFEAVIECIDAKAMEVEKECEVVCHGRERLAHWAVQTGLFDNFMEGALGTLTNGESLAGNLFGRRSSDGGGSSAAAAINKNQFAAVAERVLDGVKQSQWLGATGGQMAGIPRIFPDAGRKPRAINPPHQPAFNFSPLIAPSFVRNVPPVASVPAARGLFGGGNGKSALGPSRLDRVSPDLIKNVVHDGCDLTRCQLTCFRMKFDSKCGGSAGTLLSEALIRPMAESHRLVSLGTLISVVGAFMPVTCDFVFKPNVISEFRIPADLDAALRQKFRDADSTNGAGGPAGAAGTRRSDSSDGASTSEAATLPKTDSADNNHQTGADAGNADGQNLAETTTPTLELQSPASTSTSSNDATTGNNGFHEDNGPGAANNASDLDSRGDNATAATAQIETTVNRG